MTAPHIVDPAGLLGGAMAEASPDLMGSLLQSIINALLSADADAVIGAEYARPSPSRLAQRNGYRHRDLDTRVGTIDVAVPKLRKDLSPGRSSRGRRRGRFRSERRRTGAHAPSGAPRLSRATHWPRPC